MKVAASLALGIGLLALFVWQGRDQMPAIGRAISAVRPGWLAASIALALCSYVLRGLRWGVILKPLGRARPIDLVGATAAGFAASTLLPARAGEVVRPLLLSARTRLPAAGTIASILTERLADLVTVLVLFAAGVLLAGDRVAPDHLALLHRGAMIAGAGLVGASVVLALLLPRRERAVAAVAARLPERFRARAATFLDHLLDGLDVVRSPKGLLLLAVWSFATWTTACVQVIALAAAFGFSMSLAQSFVFMAVSVVGLAVPTPGGVGGFHWSVQFGLAAVTPVALATGKAFAIVHHAVCFLPITVLGLAYVAAAGTSFARLGRVAPPRQEG